MEWRSHGGCSDALGVELHRALSLCFGAWNIPSRGDVDRISNQVANVERQLRALRSELEQSEREVPGGRPVGEAARSRGIPLMAPSLLQRQLLRIRNGVPYYAGLNRAAVGQTPRDLVWQRDTARLWRYRSDQRTCAPPVLIVHSLISKAYILDLLPGNSMVGFLIGEGFDVYLLDWGRAYPADAENTLETYVEDYIPRAIEAACAIFGHRRADARRILPRRRARAARWPRPIRGRPSATWSR